MATFPTRTSPFSIFERDPFADPFGDAFEGFFRPVRGNVTGEGGVQNLAPALDVTEKSDHYLVQAELPGFNKEDIGVSVDGDQLVIQAEHSEERKEGDEQQGRAVIRERRFGKYTRTLRLGPDVQPEDIEASYDNGVLELRVPKSATQSPQSKRIEVK